MRSGELKILCRFGQKRDTLTPDNPTVLLSSRYGKYEGRSTRDLQDAVVSLLERPEIQRIFMTCVTTGDEFLDGILSLLSFMYEGTLTHQYFSDVCRN